MNFTFLSIAFPIFTQILGQMYGIFGPVVEKKELPNERVSYMLYGMITMGVLATTILSVWLLRLRLPAVHSIVAQLHDAARMSAADENVFPCEQRKPDACPDKSAKDKEIKTDKHDKVVEVNMGEPNAKVLRDYATQTKYTWQCSNYADVLNFKTDNIFINQYDIKDGETDAAPEEPVIEEMTAIDETTIEEPLINESPINEAAIEELNETKKIYKSKIPRLPRRVVF